MYGWLDYWLFNDSPYNIFASVTFQIVVENAYSDSRINAQILIKLFFFQNCFEKKNSIEIYINRKITLADMDIAKSILKTRESYSATAALMTNDKTTRLIRTIDWKRKYLQMIQE